MPPPTTATTTTTAQTKCASCGAEGQELVCATCGAVVPPNPRATPFQTLGLEARFDLDDKTIERAWLDRSRKVHPDRFARKPDQERRWAAEHTAALNDALRAIRDPYDRGTWLVKDAGVDDAKLDQRLLVALIEARERADEGEKQAVLDDSIARFRALSASLSALFAQAEPAALARAARALAEMKTLARLVDDLGGPKLIATLDGR